MVIYVILYVCGVGLGGLGLLLRWDETEPLPTPGRMRFYLLSVVLWPLSLIGLMFWAAWAGGAGLLWLLRYAATGKR